MKKFLLLGVGVMIAAGGWYAYVKYSKPMNENSRYVLATAQLGTLITSVSGSGQVSPSQEADLKPKVSGTITSVTGEEGREFAAQTEILHIDDRDARKAVRDATASLDAARLSLEKLKKPADALALLSAQNALSQSVRDLEDLKKPPDALALLSAQNALSQSKETRQKAEDTIKKSYEDGLTIIANVFLDLPNIMSGIRDILYTNQYKATQANIYYYVDQIRPINEKISAVSDATEAAYTAARTAFDKNFTDYKLVTRFSDAKTIETSINQTYTTTKLASDAVKSVQNFILLYQDTIQDRNAKHDVMDAHLASLSSYTTKLNAHLASLISTIRVIQDARTSEGDAQQTINEKTESLAKLTKAPDANTIASAQEKIKEKQEALAKLKGGPDALEVKSQELEVAQRANLVQDAQEKLSDYTFRAPFDGVIAKLAVKKGDSVSANGSIGTYISKQRIAEISLNEVDIAKVRANQKATLTFDAVPGLSISGSVAQIDTVGTLSQGVVSYIVKIGFDTQDERVRPGMTISAHIIIDAKTQILSVPNSAVKSQGQTHFVEVVDPANIVSASKRTARAGVLLLQPIRRQEVEIGSSNDEATEIVSGLSEGDTVVTAIVNANKSASQNSQQQNSAFRLPGVGTGGVRGGNGRSFR